MGSMRSEQHDNEVVGVPGVDHLSRALSNQHSIVRANQRAYGKNGPSV
jgi:hypothetical protein